jgi:dihydroflavonol-4-reductase
MLTLVTGATGLVGNNVVRALVDRGQSVRVLARASSNPKPLAEMPVEVVHGDVTDAESVNCAMDGVTHVVHAAANLHIGWHKLREQRAVNVEGTRNVAEAAMRAGARMVHVSTIDALGVGNWDPPADENTPTGCEVLSSYVVTKREAEQVIRERVARGLDAVIVNPGFMLGPWDWKPSSGRVLLDVAHGWVIIAPPGTNSYCDVRDVAVGILAALDRGRTGERYILAGQTLSYMEALTIFARLTSRHPPFRIARPFGVRLIGHVGDLWAWLTGNESDFNSATTEMSMLRKNFTSAKAAAELGYQSRNIEQSAADEWEWLKDHGYVKPSLRGA